MMDNAVFARALRQLFSHRICSQRSLRSCSSRPFSSSLQRHRDTPPSKSPWARFRTQTPERVWKKRTDFAQEDRSEDFRRFPLVDAAGLRNWKTWPRRVKMLMRDFIEDSLYNPHYGYFSKHAVIFQPGEPFEFRRLRHEPDFHRLLSKRYTAFEDALDAEQGVNNTRQLWHTPTELFTPYYGEAIARYLVDDYRLTHHPYHDLIIYEMGAGNGTLMLNILDYIRAAHPDVYARTRFKIIEISNALAKLQRQHVLAAPGGEEHAARIEIINQSVFDWDLYVPEPCWFLALEVFDNFAHDSIRYDPRTDEALQGYVLIDNQGDFYEFYSPGVEPVASRFLDRRKTACPTGFPHPLGGSPFLRRQRARLPLKHNLTAPEFIPTRLMQFFENLNQSFPRHQLLTSDFHRLPSTVPGFNAPVVQTRYQRRTVPVTTPLVHQGFFDILFPTNFAVAERLYQAITGRFTRVVSQESFLRRWADTQQTRTMSGENPMLTWYKNASVMVTV